MQAFRDVIVDDPYHLHRSSCSSIGMISLRAIVMVFCLGNLPSFRQDMENLSLPLVTMFNVLCDTLSSIINDRPVSRICSA